LGATDAFIAKLRGDDGSVAWAISLGTTGDDSILSLAVDRAGHVVVTGTLGAAFEGGPTAGGRDAFIASVETATGARRWHKVFSTDSNDYSFSASYGRNGDVYALVNLGAPTGYDFGMPII